MNHPTTGNPEIDDGHERIQALLEKLRYNPENIEEVVQELVASFRAHCRDEEALMRVRKFRGLKAHAAEHRAITAHFSEGLLGEILGAGSHDEVLKAVDRGSQMLMDHIQCRDFELALHLARKPVRGKPGK